MTEALDILFQKYEHQGTGLQPADTTELEKSYHMLVSEFGVPEDQALVTLESGIKHRLGLIQAPPPEAHEREEPIPITDATPPGYYAVRAKVIKLFEPRHPRMHQTGLIGDESAVVRFVSWKSKGAEPTIEAGKCYELQDVYTTAYQDRTTVNLTAATATEIEDDITVAPAPGEILIGAITRILSAGIVRRCTAKDCRKTVEIGPGGYVCPTHGMIEEPRPDLRARVVLDNGHQAAVVYLNAGILEKLTWLSLAGAVDLAEGARVGGHFIVEDKIRSALFGKYLRVYASPMSGQFYASDAELVHSFDVFKDIDPEQPWTLKEDPEWQPTIGHRSFVAELSGVREIVKDGKEKMSPTFAILPSGEKAARFFWAGVLTEKTKRDDSIVCKINDPTGTLRLKAHRQYQGRAFMALQNIEAPALIAVAGKLNVYKPPDSEDVYVSIVPSEVAAIDKATRVIWIEETLAGMGEYSETFIPVEKFLEEHRGDADVE